MIRPRRVATGKLRHCIRCPRVFRDPRNRVCSTCRSQKSGQRIAMYRGPCLDGCGAPAGGRSGYAPLCWRKLAHRNRMFRRLLRRVGSVDLPLSVAREALALEGHPMFRPTVAALRALLDGVADGRVAFYGGRGPAVTVAMMAKPGRRGAPGFTLHLTGERG